MSGRIYLLAALAIWHICSLSAHGEDPVSFRYDILPVLSKQGCSEGTCHGSPKGKGGFRLSLRGFDPQLDHFTLTREFAGRRLNLIHPDRSLLLAKPTMQLSHGGGLKMKSGDLAFTLLKTWLAAGCPDDPADAPECQRIALLPGGGEFNLADARPQFKVQAYFSNGTVRDVTPLTRFSSSVDKVASVSGIGVVTAGKRGEATIVARYLDFIDTVDLHFLDPVEGFNWQPQPKKNVIDRIVFPRLEKLQLSPSALSDDNEFIRRVYLDVLGIMPTRTEVESFLTDQSDDKRSQLIDQLLERPEYSQFSAQKRGDLLRINAKKLGIAGVTTVHRWLVDSVRENRPFDQFARELLTAQGSTTVNPSANYFRAATGANDSAESVSQLFLGIRIQCAKCHNHPFDRWSQDNYYGISAFFSRVQQKQEKDSDEVTIWLDDKSELVQPRTGKQVLPWLPLSGEVVLTPEQTDRRKVLADWLTAPDNPFFARVAVNRIWAHLFGRGIVEPVDDFRADNPPSHPQLLDELAKRFVDGGYDQKAIIRLLLNSRVYQLNSKTNDSNQDDEKYFSHAYARLLSAEQLLDGISHVTGVPERFGNLPIGTRATSLPSPDFGTEFLKIFGQPDRNTVCDCERVRQPNLSQVLQLVNGPLIRRKLGDGGGRLARLLDNLPARLAAAGSPVDEGLVAWFRADAGVSDAGGSRAVDGEFVKQWKNQCAAQPSVHQDDESKRPVYVTNSIGGLPAVRFDGKDDFVHNIQDSLLAATTPRTVVVIGRLDGTTGGALFTFGRARVNGSSVFTAQHVSIGGKYYVYSDGVNSPGNTTAPADRLLALQSPFITTFISPGPGKKLRVVVNGTDLPVEQPDSVGPVMGVGGFTIGSREDIPPGVQIWNGDISEVLVYDHAFNDTELAATGKYLATKYNLTAADYPRAQVPVDSQVTNREVIIELYFAAFARAPLAKELDVALEHIGRFKDRRQGIEEIGWALLNSKELLFQH